MGETKSYKIIEVGDYSNSGNVTSRKLAKSAFSLCNRETYRYGSLTAELCADDDIRMRMACDFKNLSRIIVAVENGVHIDEGGGVIHLLGMLELTLQPSLLAIVSNLAVDKEHRGRGIGSDLLKHGENIAQQNNIDKVTLTALSQAHEFYSKMGYEGPKLSVVDSIMTKKLTDES